MIKIADVYHFPFIEDIETLVDKALKQGFKAEGAIAKDGTLSKKEKTPGKRTGLHLVRMIFEKSLAKRSGGWTS